MDLTINNAEIQDAVDSLNSKLATYAYLARKSPDEVLLRVGEKLGFEWYKQLRKNAPEKGSIRSQNEAEMHQGRGIKLSKASRKFADKHSVATQSKLSTRKASGFMEVNKRGNLKRNGANWYQLAVKRELNLRESGRVFTAFAARYQNLKRKIAGTSRHRIANYFDRTRRFIAEAGIDITDDGGVMQFSWGGGPSSDKAAAALKVPKNRQALKGALSAVANDMQVYIDRKLTESKRKAGLN